MKSIKFLTLALLILVTCLSVISFGLFKAEAIEESSMADAELLGNPAGNQLDGHSPINLGENFVAFIRQTSSGKYITRDIWNNVVVADGTPDDYGRFIGSQQWHFTRQSDGSYCIANDESGKCLDVASGAYVDGTNIQVYDPNNQDPQRFYVYFINGNFYIRCRASTKVIDVDAGSSNVQLYGDSTGEENGVSASRAFEILKFNNDYEGWNLNFGTDITVYVRNVETSKMMTINPINWDVNFNDATYDDNQKWRLELRNDGSYEFISVSTGLALDVLNGSLDAGTTVDAYNDTGHRAQGFYILPSDRSDYYMIKPCYSSNVLDMDGSTGDLHIYPPNLSDSTSRAAQVFEIVFENAFGNWFPPINLGNEFSAFITNIETGNTITELGTGNVCVTETTYKANQLFRFKYDESTKSYQIIGNSGKAIECMWGCYNDGGPLVMIDCHDGAWQRFRLHATFEEGCYLISPVHTNKLVNVDTVITSNISLFNPFEASCSKFKLTIIAEDKLVLKDTSSCVQDGTNLFKVPAGQKAKKILYNFLNPFASVHDTNDILISEDKIVGTGYNVSLYIDGIKKDFATIIIYGDVDGDGIITTTDYIRIKSNFLDTFILDDIALKAADVDGDGEITTTDYLRIKGHFLDEFDLYPEDEYTSFEDITPTFKNPSLYTMADPFVMYHDGYYYAIATNSFSITIYRSKTLTTIYEDETKTIFGISETGEIQGSIWAPEIHYIPATQKWYVYACGTTNGNEFNSMRMFCLESETDDIWSSDYTYKGLTDPNLLAIDQTVFYDEATGNLYTTFSEFIEDSVQVITLALMDDPWTISNQRIRISSPTYDWEIKGANPPERPNSKVNEGPIFTYKNGKLCLIYSASGCWSQYYCLGLVEFTGNDFSVENVINLNNWNKYSDPVFSAANEVYGVGHCSFFQSPDGTETWIAYHGMHTPDAGEAGRYLYYQKIDFDENGVPVLGEPLSRDTRIPYPSGDPQANP